MRVPRQRRLGQQGRGALELVIVDEGGGGVLGQCTSVS